MVINNKIWIVGEAMQGYIPIIAANVSTTPRFASGWPLRKISNGYWAPGIKTYFQSIMEGAAFTEEYFQSNYLDATSQSEVDMDLKSKGRLIRLLSLRFPNVVKERNSFFCRFIKDSRAYEIEVGYYGLDLKVECYEKYRDVMRGEKLSILTLIKKAEKEKSPYTWGLTEKPALYNSYFKDMLRLTDYRIATIASKGFKSTCVGNIPEIELSKFHKFSNSRNRKDFRLLKHFVAFLKEPFMHNAEKLKLFP